MRPERISPGTAVREAAPWIERLARFGYAAKGVVYVLVGVLAARAAVGAGGEVTDSEGAFRTVLQQPFGKFLLMAIGIGLAGYALWRFIAAITDAEGHGSDAKGLGARAFMVRTGAIHAALAIQAFRFASGKGQGGGNEAAQMSGSVMDKPFGQFLLGAAGSCIAAVRRQWSLVCVFAGTVLFVAFRAALLFPFSRYALPATAVWYVPAATAAAELKRRLDDRRGSRLA